MRAQGSGLASRRVLLVGAGGLGCPAAAVLARSGVGRIDVLDDDRVAESNLHRQTLYDVADAGQPKAPLALERLQSLAAVEGHELRGVAREIRLGPDAAVDAVAGYDLVLEGADNFATKFLVADACRLAGVPAVQGGAVRWVGWALAARGAGGPCIRCVFEDLPRGQQDTCAEAGVVGPVVGVIGALQGALALRVLLGDESAAGVLWSYRALEGGLRRHRLRVQPHCALCRGEITDTALSRYVPGHAA
jgi:molybdopterin/thiamine biosynthesis adenylyltransferase